jgi:nitrile hydratase accessory protein
MSDFLETSGPAGVPRKNGELIFETPWESRTFGIAIALCEKGVFDWEDFRKELITQVGKAERENFAITGMWNYYEIWTASLERVLFAKRIINREELQERATLVEAGWKHADINHHH